MADANWNFTSEQLRVVDRVVRAVDVSLDPAIDRDDVRQEALLYLATASDLARDLEGGLLFNRVLTNVLRSLGLSWDRSLVELDEALEVARNEAARRTQDYTSGFGNRPTPEEFKDSAYTPARIEALLPAIWDDDYCKGVPDPKAPDHDMPRAPSDPSKSGTYMAELADIKRAWEKAPLTTRQRQALLLRFGFDETQSGVGEHLDISQQKAQEHIEAGVLKVTRWLNGDVRPPQTCDWDGALEELLAESLVGQ